MYTVKTKKSMSKKKLVNNVELMTLDGFLMASKSKVFKIQDSNIREIKVVNEKLANPLVSKKVFKQYDKLILLLTDLLTDDDDTGESLQEALNEIEKFRLQIKVKYREYLKQKELSKMSKQLKIIQNEANRRLIELNEYYHLENTSHRSR